MNRSASLADLLEDESGTWLSEPGDLLGGDILDLETRNGNWGPYPIVTILVTEPRSTERNGTAVPVGSVRKWHACGAVPRAELKEQQPRIGDQIVVKDLGIPVGKRYRKWRIKVVKDTSPVNETVSDGDDAAADEGRMDAVGVEPDSEGESFAELFRMASAGTAQVGPGEQIPYR